MSNSIQWTCPECGYSQEWDYENLANQGNPVCPECDGDMEWEGTEDD